LLLWRRWGKGQRDAPCLLLLTHTLAPSRSSWPLTDTPVALAPQRHCQRCSHLVLLCLNVHGVHGMPVIYCCPPTMFCRAEALMLGCHADFFASSCFTHTNKPPCPCRRQALDWCLVGTRVMNTIGLTGALSRPLPAAWVAGSHVRVLPRLEWLHMSGSGQRSRVPDGSCI
jgi:hypothetical protein